MLCVLAALAARGADTQLKVMSFNIRCTMDSDKGDLSWDARKEPCLKMLAAERPDVVAFQEPRTDQVEFLKENLPQYACLAEPVRLPTATLPQHNVIMFLRDKYELLDSGHYFMSETPETMSKGWDGDQNRLTIWVHLRDNSTGGDFFFFCTHLDHKGAEARLKGSELNLSMMKKIAGNKNPVFIMGDMNASYAPNDMRRAQLEPYYRWMWSARETALDTDLETLSYNGFDLSKQRSTWNIDYIFYRKAKALEYRVIDTPAYGVEYISDHWPITMICEF